MVINIAPPNDSAQLVNPSLRVTAIFSVSTYIALLLLYHFGVGGFHHFMQRLELGSVRIYLVAFPIWAVVTGYIAALLFWQLPSMIAQRKYDVTPRSMAAAYVIGGVASMLLGATFLALRLAISGGPGEFVLVPAGLLFGGFASLIQGLGILLFRSKMMGLIVMVYALMAGCVLVLCACLP